MDATFKKYAQFICMKIPKIRAGEFTETIFFTGFYFRIFSSHQLDQLSENSYFENRYFEKQFATAFQAKTLWQYFAKKHTHASRETFENSYFEKKFATVFQGKTL